MGVLLVTCIVIFAIGYYQFKPWLQRYLIETLNQQGLQNVKVNVASISPSRAVLDKIQFGEDDKLFVIEDVTLKYTLSDLQHRRINEIEFSNVAIKAVQQEEGWIVYGIDGLKSDQENTNPLSFISLSTEQVEQIPFKRLGVKDSIVQLLGDFGEITVPVNAEWRKNDNPNLIYGTESISLKKDDLEAQMINPKMKLFLKEGAWDGTWTTEHILLKNSSLPKIAANGLVSANQEILKTSGKFESEDSVYSGDFDFQYKPSVEPSMSMNGNALVDMPISGGQFKMPATLGWASDSPLKIDGSGGRLNWASGDLSAEAQEIAANISQSDKGFSGDWKTSKINVTAPIAVPTLWGSGKVDMVGSNIKLNGAISSNDKAWKANFAMRLGASNKANNGLRINAAEMPWNKGRIKIKDVWVPFETKSSIKIDMQVERVDLAELMNLLTGNRIEAKGIVSGFVKVTIDKNGNILVDDGKLGADGPGTIIMPPETIPASNEQVDLVKDIMQDLHFEVLNISAQPDENGELTLKLTVEGKNPKVFEGHPVKLNINLTGNLLEFIEQNLILFTKPEQILKKEAK